MSSPGFDAQQAQLRALEAARKAIAVAAILAQHGLRVATQAWREGTKWALKQYHNRDRLLPTVRRHGHSFQRAPMGTRALVMAGALFFALLVATNRLVTHIASRPNSPPEAKRSPVPVPATATEPAALDLSGLTGVELLRKYALAQMENNLDRPWGVISAGYFKCKDEKESRKVAGPGGTSKHGTGPAEVGWSTVSRQERVDPNKAVQHPIGAVGKTFVGTEIAVLEAKGMLNLTDTIGHHWPDLLQHNEVFADLEIGSVVTHTSALPRDLPLETLAGSAPKHLKDLLVRRSWEGTSCPALAMLTENIELLGKPGTMYAPSNVGIALLACMVEAIRAKRAIEAISEDLWHPMGMASTGPPEFLDEESVQNKVDKLQLGELEDIGVDEQGEAVLGHPTGGTVEFLRAADNAVFDMFQFAGGLVSNVPAMLAYGRALSGCAEQPKNDGAAAKLHEIASALPLLSEQLIERKAHNSQHANGVGRVWQSYKDSSGEVYLFHEGSAMGCHTSLWVNVNRTCGAVVMTNFLQAVPSSESSEVVREPVDESRPDAWKAHVFHTKTDVVGAVRNTILADACGGEGKPAQQPAENSKGKEKAKPEATTPAP
ncbi:unnamed protein product [Pedinophyceae sp. YPF-701]|nr:unnamed protein product [Pedinophyceae sp. YPF-701]